MKLSNISIAFLSLFITVIPMTIQAQNSVKKDAETISRSIGRRWDKREVMRYSGWERLKPTHYKLQYAGGMGELSLALGWDYGRHNQWETDVILGYIPNRHHSRYHLIFTLKENYIPWNMSFGPHWNLDPIYGGIYMTTISGDDFWKKEPGKYPNKYYNMSTKIRTSIFLGQRIGFKDLTPFIKNLQFFYELSTNELYIVSKFDNKYLKMKDILRLSFGIRIHIFKENRFQTYRIRN